ncbi:hypothetical protein MASR2M17_03800 [Aminivibrio sp.]
MPVTVKRPSARGGQLLHPEATGRPILEARRVTFPAAQFCSWITAGIPAILAARRGTKETYPPKRTQQSVPEVLRKLRKEKKAEKVCRHRFVLSRSPLTPKGEPDRGRQKGSILREA